MCIYYKYITYFWKIDQYRQHKGNLDNYTKQNRMVRICDTDFPEQSDYAHHFSSMTSGKFQLSSFQKYAISETVKGNHCLLYTSDAADE